VDHFRYIDTIRRPDGTLRPWREHDVLARSEDYYNGVRRDEYSYRAEATRIKKMEYADMYWVRKSK